MDRIGLSATLIHLIGVSSEVYSEEVVRAVAAVSKRHAITRHIRANRARARRGRVTKCANGHGAEETAVAALNSLFESAKQYLGNMNPAKEIPTPGRQSKSAPAIVRTRRVVLPDRHRRRPRHPCRFSMIVNTRSP